MKYALLIIISVCFLLTQSVSAATLPALNSSQAPMSQSMTMDEHCHHDSKVMQTKVSNMTHDCCQTEQHDCQGSCEPCGVVAGVSLTYSALKMSLPRSTQAMAFHNRFFYQYHPDPSLRPPIA
ncbi:hypothetical protein [Parashewanella tropica]|uniref:hypothetical protein n=1 Tax=Parashewanella tropica TaxID=2547970 RepID=UPI0010599610|nr:hypothetical protein [Parashewanella tropica]